jgi:hypothetical protein
MIGLPHVPDDAWLASFGAAVGVVAGGMVAVIAAASAGPIWVLAGTAVTGAIVVAALLWPRAWLAPYRQWNRAARRVSRAARTAVLRVAWFVVVTATARAAGGRGTSPHGVWTPRRSLAPDAYASQFDRPAAAHERGWLGVLGALAARPQNRWAWALLPFLCLLRVFDEDQEARVASNIYTLY